MEGRMQEEGRGPALRQETHWLPPLPSGVGETHGGTALIVPYFLREKNQHFRLFNMDQTPAQLSGLF
jgi:hypothetical protein